MPELDRYLHYRIVGKSINDAVCDGLPTVFSDSIDVSSIKVRPEDRRRKLKVDLSCAQELAKRWYPGDVARRGEQEKERFISHR